MTQELATFIFFEEGKQSTPEFEIEATDFEMAYDLAYDKYGPQVDDLYYMRKPNTTTPKVNQTI